MLAVCERDQVKTKMKLNKTEIVLITWSVNVEQPNNTQLKTLSSLVPGLQKKIFGLVNNVVASFFFF